jgi:hypothetical protein
VASDELEETEARRQATLLRLNALELRDSDAHRVETLRVGRILEAEAAEAARKAERSGRRGALALLRGNG